MNNEKYKNIIDMQPPEPPDGKRMPTQDRAAQFAPFAALSGYDDAVEETARVTEEKAYMNEDAINSIDLCLRELAQNISDRPSVSITYFVPDNKKSGGRYITEIRRVKKIDTLIGTVTLIPPTDKSPDNSTPNSHGDLTLNLSDVVSLIPIDMLN